MEIVLILLGLIGGGAATFFIQKTALKAQTAKVLKDAEIEAENIRKERALQSKETFLKQKEEHEIFIKDRERKLQSKRYITRKEKKPAMLQTSLYMQMHSNYNKHIHLTYNK